MKDLPASSYSGFITHFEAERSNLLRGRIEGGYTFSDSYSRSDWGLNSKEIFLISMDPSDQGKIHAAILVERMHGTGGTDKPKFEFSRRVVFENAVEIKLALGDVDVSSIVSSPESGRRVELEHWNRLIVLIKLLNAEQIEELDNLLALVDRSAQILGGDNKGDRLAEQRDSIGLALEIAGIRKSAALAGMVDSDAEDASDVLDLIDGLLIQERSLVEYDQPLIERFLLGKVRGAVVGTGYDRSVRVYVTDKTPLETALGIDLLIYQKHYNAYILVQYKCMERVNGKTGNWSYSKDQQFDDQLLAMKRANEVIRARPQSVQDVWYSRLNSDPFYFKFCERRKPKAKDDSLISGMTLSAQHAEEFFLLDRSEGPKGGRRIGYENCPKYLNNTEFISLARGGWIGTDESGSKVLSDVIRASQEKGRAAMLAILTLPQQTTSQHRKIRKG